jgi:hypothetical protein
MWIVYFAGREIFRVLILKSIEEWEGVMTKINSGFKLNKQTFFARALTSIFLATVHVLKSKKKINERQYIWQNIDLQNTEQFSS